MRHKTKQLLSVFVCLSLCLSLCVSCPQLKTRCYYSYCFYNELIENFTLGVESNRQRGRMASRNGQNFLEAENIVVSFPKKQAR